MTPLIRKEIRLLLPFFGIALFLAILPAWIVSEYSFAWSGNETIFWIFGFGLVLLGLAPFGQEVGLGTFSMSLAQPAQRNRIWMTKLLLILVAALLVLLALIVSIHLRFDSLLNEVARRIAEDTRAKSVWDLDYQKSLLKNLNSHAFWWIGLAAAAVGLSGGLWSSLLFRQIGAALWFALLVPAAFFLGIEWFVPGENAREILLLVGAAAYSIAGVFWARRLFLRAQDIQWLGDTISPFGFRSATAQAASADLRRPRSLRALVLKEPLRALILKEIQSHQIGYPKLAIVLLLATLLRPLRALVLKEIQFHQISYFIAFGLLVLHICTLAFRKFVPMSNNSELRFAVESVPFLWFLLPWLLGSVAVAEERKLGTVESQFCVPVRRFSQFIVKLAIVLLLGVALGALVPGLLEAGGSLLGISSGVSEAHFFFGPNEFFSFTQNAAIVAATLAGISFFASTLTRNTLHALGAAVVFTGAFWTLYQWVIREADGNFDYSLWSGPLIFRIGVPVLIAVTLWSSWSNYKLLQINGKVWLRNALILGASLFLVGIGTAAIYQRPWELLTSVEPKHGPARLSGPARPALCVSDYRLFALLPDGRLWAAADYQWKELHRGQFNYWDSLGQTNHVAWLQSAIPDSGQFVAGSNWVSVAAISGEVVALQSDGSLWQILSWRDKTNTFSWKDWLSSKPEPRRIGSDNDWKSVVGDQRQKFTALKTDGTVWHWGFAGESESRYLKQPVRIGTDSDWAAIFGNGYEVLFMKSDGDIWYRERSPSGHYQFERRHQNGSDWLQVAGSFYLHKDGSLWANGWFPRIVFGTRIPARPGTEMHRIGNDSDWQRISANTLIVALKNGKIVENNRELFSAPLGQPSRYSDWLTLSAERDTLLAVAADGTISCWFPRGTGRLLGPTRHPLWTMNVLDGTQ